MAIKSKRPMMKETVGAQYYAFNVPDEDGNVDLENYEQTVKTDEKKRNNCLYNNVRGMACRSTGRRPEGWRTD